MRSIASKVTPEFQKKVISAAGERRQTVSTFLRTAAENEINGRKRATLRERFGHCFGAAKKLAPDVSTKEGYAD